MWGITASDSAKGYVAWGGPPRHPAIDGSVVPCAAGGSLMFAPDITLPVVRDAARRAGAIACTAATASSTPSTRPTAGSNPDVIGIDVGITLLSAENLRTGAVWRWFMANPEIPRALRAVGVA